MAIRITQYEQEVARKQGEFDLIQRNLASAKKAVGELKVLLDNILEAQRVIQTVAVTTQSSIVFRINDIVNKVIQAGFPEYSFELKYEVHRNKSEAVMKFYCDGEPIEILSDAGGVVDLASTGLRFALWSLSNTANVIILDEALKFVSADLRPRASEILAEICKTLGVQVIMVTHLEEIIENADKVIKVSKKGKYSSVM
jgi:DNA repair exonuclease SbcCD ATPase subunit